MTVVPTNKTTWGRALLMIYWSLSIGRLDATQNLQRIRIWNMLSTTTHASFLLSQTVNGSQTPY